MESIKQIVEWSAAGIEFATIVLIVGGILFGSARFLWHLNTSVSDSFQQYKVHLGKMLILALEFLVAADIIRTVALEQTFNNVLMLGLLVVIRTFLSWSLSVEIEGRWPWSKRSDEISLEVNEK